MRFPVRLSVSGRILDVETSQPLPGANVVLTVFDAGEAVSDQHEPARTDTDGRFAAELNARLLGRVCPTDARAARSAPDEIEVHVTLGALSGTLRIPIAENQIVTTGFGRAIDLGDIPVSLSGE